MSQNRAELIVLAESSEEKEERDSMEGTRERR